MRARRRWRRARSSRSRSDPACRVLPGWERRMTLDERAAVAGSAAEALKRHPATTQRMTLDGRQGTARTCATEDLHGDHLDLPTAQRHFKPATPKASRSSVTRRRAGAMACDSRQARRPARALAAGIDAASMARRCQEPLQKMANVFLHPLTRWRGRVGRGSDRRRARRDAGGSPRSALEELERGQAASAR